MRNKDEKGKAEQVEGYIDQDAAYTGELDTATERVVDTIQQAVSETQPRPGFINELANQLRKQETMMSDKPTRNFWGIASRLLLGGAAVAAVALFALYLTGLFGSPGVEPAVSENPVPPRPQLQAGGGQHFPDAEFKVMVSLDDETGEAPLYQAQPLPLPDTVAEAQALGARFGLEAPTVYESPSDPGRWIVMGTNRRNITFGTAGRAPEGLFYATGDLPSGTFDGEPATDAEAEAAAISFLQAAEMLPESYEVQLVPTASPVRNVRILPLLAGHPLRGNTAPIEVGVAPDGEIVHARISLLNVEETGENIPVKSAQEAFTELVEGTSPSLSYSFERGPNVSGEQVQYFSPPPPDHASGDAVTIAGWVNVLVPVADGELQATLHDRNGSTYYLEGPAVAGLRDAPAQDTVLVDGTIGEQLGPQSWHLVVDEITPQMPIDVQCYTGQINRDEDNGVLETDDGERYPLAYLPESLQNGARAEVCADTFDGEQPVAWLHIQSPPGAMMAGGGGGGGGSVSVSVETVEGAVVEREMVEQSTAEGAPAAVDEAPAPAAPAPGPATSGGGTSSSEPAVPVAGESGSGGGGGGGGISGGPASADSPYQLGEVVEVTGIVEGFIQQDESGPRNLRLTLRHEEPGDDGNQFFIFSLLGDPQLLEEIAQENRLHVRVTAQVIPQPEGRQGTHGQALIVQEFERVYPDEKIELFLGHLDQESVDGNLIPVFVDARSDQRYGLLYPLGPDSDHEQQRQVWVAGVVHPERTVGNLPLLQVYESRTGNEVDAAEDPGDIPFDPALPVVDMTQMNRGGLQGTLIVDRVERGYTFEPAAGMPPTPAGEEPPAAEEPVTVYPSWFFYGHTEDGGTTFTITVPAAVEMGGGRE